MPILTLEETKTWLRVDGADEDSLIQTLIGAAEEYLRNAVEVEFDSTNQLAKLFCLVICADWYENRDLIGSQPSDKIRFSVQSMLAQLQHAYAPPPETTP
ncbi:head-tail connector protein [Brevibacillus composti]|uniref:Phage gp6-like head-tail connector protein n=1 Tax=Brevibacillus composti TaxID=2796470 RepID=A0A7T5EMA2_9BACL|nr:head-tail connector protein [Brevibacillus composti]QQE75214.1 phage gp6-like head-tail connector protein [Brevibacillus composti]